METFKFCTADKLAGQSHIRYEYKCKGTARKILLGKQIFAVIGFWKQVKEIKATNLQKKEWSNVRNIVFNILVS